MIFAVGCGATEVAEPEPEPIEEEVFDFSATTEAGIYHAESGYASSPSFSISKNIYDDALNSSIKMLYYQRCGQGVGGPNSGLDDPYVQNVLKDTPSAKCYADNSQSYSTNEVTIYWNSPIIYLLAGEISEQ